MPEAKMSRLTATMFAIALATSARGEVISWVGYQAGPIGGGLPLSVWGNRASFFHGDQWFSYRVPDDHCERPVDNPFDIAVFDQRFDPQQNGMPKNVYFGDFTVNAVPPYVPDNFVVSGGCDAVIDRLVVRDGAFAFHFTSDTGTPQGSLTTRAQMTIADEPDTNAALRIVGGRLTTGFVTHIAPGVNSNGAVEVDGPGAEWIHNSYVDLGWVGDGRVTVRNGGYLQSSGTILAGIRDGSKGTLEILSGGDVVAQNGVLIGNGHEATGLARGVLTIRGGGSRLTTPSLQFGGGGGRGAGVVATDGRAEVANSVYLYPNSSLDVSQGGMVNIGSGDWPEGGTVRVGPGGVLGGSGKVIGDVLIDGGVFSPGFSPGVFEVTGNVNLRPENVLLMEIGGLVAGTEYDQMLVTSNLALAGAVEVSFINDFLPQVGDTFNLFTAGGNFVPPGTLTFLNAPAGFDYMVGLDSGVFSLTVTAVPEPAPLWLLGFAAIVVMLGRSKSAV